ncbi:efflux RND transporter periplasmic adaptor subunit [Thermogemmatispora sp.]|uniref:efflux RND transporter periplasmic adaptor subunit n=1 Tax=Thermogemmatispora sp. TaxID=1968838 RepID=UPI0035E442F6
MAQEPIRRRQFKPGVGVPPSQVHFSFEEERSPLALPPLVRSTEKEQAACSAGGQSNAEEKLRPAFIPQPLPIPDPEESLERPIWQITTLQLRVLPGVWRRRREGRRTLLLFASGGLLALLLLGLLAIFLRSSTPAVVLYQVQTQDYDQIVGGEGLVYPQSQLALSLPFAGRVEALLVKVGDFVRVGQPILRLDPLELSLQLKLARDELAAAESYLQEVMEAGNNPTAVAQARQRYALAKSRYEALQARSSSLLAENCLLAPLSGVVTAISVVAGQSFSANIPLLTISDQSRVIVHVRLPLRDLGLIHVGQAAEIVTGLGQGPALSGTVLTIVPRADPQTETFEVWVALDNRHNALLPGMSVFVRIVVKGKALSLPRLAVLDLDLAPAVFVVKRQQAHLRSVHVAARSPARAFVDVGLSSGELVVLIGLADLQEGQQVRVLSIERG